MIIQVFMHLANGETDVYKVLKGYMYCIKCGIYFKKRKVTGKRLDSSIVPKDLFYLLQNLIFTFFPFHIFVLDSSFVTQNISFLG